MDRILFKSRPSSNNKKNSQISKRSFSASSTLRGMTNTHLTSSASFGNSKYLKNVGMLEFAGSPYLESLNKSQNKIVSNYKTPEEYHDEVLALKKKIQELQSEISILKFKVRHSEEEISKKQRLINESLNSKILESSSLDPHTIINNLKLKVTKVQEKYREKESALSKLQKSIKATHVKEMEITIESLNEEIVRLNNLISKTQTKADDSLKPNRKNKNKSIDNRIKDLTSTILKMTSVKNRLLLENKSLRIALQRSHEVQENMKKNFDIALENQRKFLQENEMSSSFPNYDARVMDRFMEKEKEFKSEIDKLKRDIIKIKDEKNLYKEKCTSLEKNKTPRNNKHDSENESITTPPREKITKKTSNESFKQKRKESWDQHDIELLQSIFRNHQERHNFLYHKNVNKNVIDSDSESLIEAAELIKSVVSNFKIQ